MKILFGLIGFCLLSYLVGLVFFRKVADPRTRLVLILLTSGVLVALIVGSIMFMEERTQQKKEIEYRAQRQAELNNINYLHCYSGNGNEITFFNQQNNQAEFEGKIYKVIGGTDTTFTIKGRVRKAGQKLEIITAGYNGELILGEGNISLTGTIIDSTGAAFLLNGSPCRK